MKALKLAPLVSVLCASTPWLAPVANAADTVTCKKEAKIYCLERHDKAIYTYAWNAGSFVETLAVPRSSKWTVNS